MVNIISLSLSELGLLVRNVSLQLAPYSTAVP